jgi:hypothetical protein
LPLLERIRKHTTPASEDERTTRMALAFPGVGMVAWGFWAVVLFST